MYYNKMYVTLTKRFCQLGVNIDNCQGDKKIGLHEIYFSAAWNNISAKLKNNVIKVIQPKGINSEIHIPDGYYDFCTLKKYFLEECELEMELNSSNSVVTLTLPPIERMFYVFPRKLAELIGFESYFKSASAAIRNEGVYRVTENDITFRGKVKIKTKLTAPDSINLTVNKIVFVHLNELSTSENVLNNHRSNLLRAFPSGSDAFCKPVHHTFQNPQYRSLREGVINSFTVSLMNEARKPLDVKDMVVVLEIV